MAMGPKNLYICLVILARVGGGEPLKFIDAPLASDEDEAKEIAVTEARRQSPEYANATLLEVTAYSFKRSKLEQAAREILGWYPRLMVSATRRFCQLLHIA